MLEAFVNWEMMINPSSITGRGISDWWSVDCLPPGEYVLTQPEVEHYLPSTFFSYLQYFVPSRCDPAEAKP